MAARIPVVQAGSLERRSSRTDDAKIRTRKILVSVSSRVRIFSWSSLQRRSSRTRREQGGWGCII